MICSLKDDGVLEQQITSAVFVFLFSLVCLYADKMSSKFKLILKLSHVYTKQTVTNLNIACIAKHKLYNPHSNFSLLKIPQQGIHDFDHLFQPIINPFKKWASVKHLKVVFVSTASGVSLLV